MAGQHLGRIGILDLLIGGDTVLFRKGIADAEKSLGGLQGKFAEAGRAAAMFSAAAVVAGTAVFAFAKRTADAMDEIGKMSERIGVSVESLSALKHAAKLSDVSLEQLSVGMRQLSKNMADARAGTGEARMAFAALGLQMEDGHGKLKTTEAMLLELADKLAPLKGTTEQTAFAMRIFGEAGAQLLPLLNKGSGGIRAMMEEARRLGLVITEDAAKAARDFNDNLTRMQGAVEGLSFRLGGPMVRAFGDAARAMLEAQQNGEGFFRTMSEGLNQLIAGSDRQRFNKEMADAGEALVRAQDRLDRARRGDLPARPGKSVADDIRDAAAAVVKAEAEIVRLRGIQPILAPDAPERPRGGGVTPPAMQAPGGNRDEATARALQEGIEEEQRIQLEAWEWTVKFRDEQLEAERKFREDKNAIIFAAIDAEQEAAIRAGEELLEAEAAQKARKLADERAYVAGRDQLMGHLSSLMNTESKKMFKIGKAAALVEAGVKGWQAVMNAYEWGSKFGGPVGGAVAAGAAAVATANILNNIRSQNFGGSATPARAPAQGSSNISGGGAAAASAPAQQSSRGPITIVGLDPRKLFSGAQLIDLLNELSRDGSEIRFARS